MLTHCKRCRWLRHCGMLFLLTYIMPLSPQMPLKTVCKPVRFRFVITRVLWTDYFTVFFFHIVAYVLLFDDYLLLLYDVVAFVFFYVSLFSSSCKALCSVNGAVINKLYLPTSLVFSSYLLQQTSYKSTHCATFVKLTHIAVIYLPYGYVHCCHCNLPVSHHLHLEIKQYIASFLLCTHPVFLFEKHSEDLFSEEEKVKSSENDRRLGHVEIHHWVKPKGLSCRKGDGVSW